MPEQLSPFEQQREALAEKLKLREQYESQIKTLNETGILEILPDSQELGIIGIDGKGYPIPTYEQILERITTEKVELLTKKFEQGFTQLLLVPFGMALDILIDRYRRELLKHDQEGTLFLTNKQKLYINRENPFRTDNYQKVDILGELLYDPQEFFPNTRGKTKIESIQEKGPWQIILTEDLPNLPAKRKGKIIQGRRQLEPNKSADKFLKLLRKDSHYQGETGLYPENWLILALTYLHQKDIQIEVGASNLEACLLIATAFKEFSDVPCIDWLSNQFILRQTHWQFSDRFISTRTRVEI
jgi:hypothetical protein